MTRPLHIVAACTDRKRRSAGAPLRFGVVTQASTLAARAKAWTKALKNATAHGTAADLYAGEHWTTSLELPMAAERHWKPRLWVASAGYGLVAADELVAPYSATFSSASADGVTTGIEGGRPRLREEWWRELTGRGQSLEDLAKAQPDSTLLIVASPAYVEAMAEDLLRSAEILGEERVVVVTSKVRAGELETFTVPSDARLLHYTGGSRVSLNARTALHALSSVSPMRFTPRSLRRRYTKLASDAPELETFGHRVARTDDQVRKFIGKLVRKDPKLSATPALRTLRAQGFRCEQKRFRRLFEEVKARGA